MKYVTWTGVALLAALWAGSLAGQEAAKGADGETEVEVEDFGYVGQFYPAKGAEETHMYCVACHSEMLVIQQGQTREGWEKLLHWMVDEQGMEPIPDEDYDIVLDYLATHYNTDRPHFPDGSN